jgi:hypothetical protein
MNIDKWRRGQCGVHGRADLIGRKHPLKNIPVTPATSNVQH